MQWSKALLVMSKLDFSNILLGLSLRLWNMQNQVFFCVYSWSFYIEIELTPPEDWGAQLMGKRSKQQSQEFQLVFNEG